MMAGAVEEPVRRVVSEIGDEAAIDRVPMATRAVETARLMTHTPWGPVTPGCDEKAAPAVVEEDWRPTQGRNCYAPEAVVADDGGGGGFEDPSAPLRSDSAASCSTVKPS